MRVIDLSLLVLMFIIMALTLSCSSAFKSQSKEVKVSIPAPNVILLRAGDRASIVCFERSPLYNYRHLKSRCFSINELRSMIEVQFVNWNGQ